MVVSINNFIPIIRDGDFFCKHHVFDVKIAKNCIKRNNQSLFFTFFVQIERSYNYFL